MKPRELYSGQAPAAMGMMGQGLSEVGASIGRIMASGYESMGKSIGAGLQSIGSAYGDMKKLDAESKASEKMYNTLRDGGYLDKGLVSAVDKQAAEMKHASTADRNAFWKDQKAFLGAAVSQRYALDRIGEESQGGVKRINAAEDARTRSIIIQQAIDQGLVMPGQGYSAPSAATPSAVPATSGPTPVASKEGVISPYDYPNGSQAGDPSGLIKPMGQDGIDRIPYRSPEEIDGMRLNPAQEKLLQDYRKRRNQRAGQGAGNPYLDFTKF